MKYKIIKRARPGRQGELGYVMQPVYDKVISYDHFTELLVRRTHLSASDLDSLMCMISTLGADKQESGYSFDLEKLGVFYLTYSSSWKDSPDELLHSHLMRARFHFRACAQLKRRLKMIKYTKVKD